MALPPEKAWTANVLPVLVWQVQPDVADVDYGSTKKQRGKLLYSLEYDGPLSEVIKWMSNCLPFMQRCTSIMLHSYFKHLNVWNLFSSSLVFSCGMSQYPSVSCYSSNWGSNKPAAWWPWTSEEPQTHMSESTSSPKRAKPMKPKCSGARWTLSSTSSSPSR